MVRLYDFAIQALSEMRQLPGLESDLDLKLETEARIAFFKAMRQGLIKLCNLPSTTGNSSNSQYSTKLFFIERKCYTILKEMNRMFIEMFLRLSPSLTSGQRKIILEKYSCIFEKRGT